MPKVARDAEHAHRQRLREGQRSLAGRSHRRSDARGHHDPHGGADLGGSGADGRLADDQRRRAIRPRSAATSSASSAPQMIDLVADVVAQPEVPGVRAAAAQGEPGCATLRCRSSQPQQLALQKFRAVMYGDHPYGRVFPTEEMIKGYTLEQVRQFYESTYGAGRARLYVVGRFDAAGGGSADQEGVRRMGEGQRTVAADPPKPTSDARGPHHRSPGRAAVHGHPRACRRSIRRAPTSSR